MKDNAVKQMRVTSLQLEKLTSWAGKKSIQFDKSVINKDLLDIHGPGNYNLKKLVDLAKLSDSSASPPKQASEK